MELEQLQQDQQHQQFNHNNTQHDKSQQIEEEKEIRNEGRSTCIEVEHVCTNATGGIWRDCTLLFQINATPN